MSEPEMRIVKVPMLDTGLGREAGFASDAEMIDVATGQRAWLESVLTPEALASLDAAEREAARRLIGGGA
jgi:hypothetical protein